MGLDFSNKSIEEKSIYMLMMRPLFLKKGLFSDTTENYISPSEPNAFDTVTIRFRTSRDNVDKVWLMENGNAHEMSIASSTESYDYYKCEITLSDKEFMYYFKIQSGNLVCFYDFRGIVKTDRDTLPFSVMPGFHTPEWAKGAVMYQIYTERFCNGDPDNDVQTGEYYYVGGPVQKIDDWYKNPAVDGTKEFYGGDLQGVINKLGYLKDLGIDAIYFNPLFVSPSNHKYDSQDYEHIDPHFGKIVTDGGECLANGDSDNRHATKYRTRVCSRENLEASDALFAELVEKAHALGIRVILDGVFNHCGSFNKWLDREGIYEGMEGFSSGSYVSGDSPYRMFFDFRDRNPWAWPNNGSYDGWWGYDTLPKLNYEASNELVDKIMEIGRKWVSAPYNADGWRLDVAADLGHSPEFNHAFFKRFREEVKGANPEALILAEHYGDPKPWLNGKEWDSVMNYDAFMEPVTWFLTGMQKHSDEFRGDLLGNADVFFSTMRYAGHKFSNCSKQVAMNQLSNHDHSRFLTRTNKRVGRINFLPSSAAEEGVDKAVMRLAVMIQMTWTGAPTIYYGDEAGVAGFTDPDNRRTYPWGREDQELISFHREMIKVHKQVMEIKAGSTKRLLSEHNLIAYGRFTDDNSTVVIINIDENERIAKFHVIGASANKGARFERIMITTKDGFSTEVVPVEYTGEEISVVMPPKSGVVICTAR